MKKKVKIKLATIIFLCFQANIIEAAVINVNRAIAFQDEGTTNVDHTALLNNLDGSFGAATGGTVSINYYATGTSNRYFDALSLNFDLSNIGFNNITGMLLRFYTQKGGYGNRGWQHYQVLEGAFNSTNEDVGMGAAGSTDFGNGNVIAANRTIGWVEESIDLDWLASDDFNVTLRLWNARIDRVELEVSTSAVPIPPALFLFSSGLIGLLSVKKKR